MLDKRITIYFIHDTISMSKRFFTFLVILMGLSILGVIAVQLVWMKNVIQVKNELFDRSVNEALNQTAQQIERRLSNSY